MDSVKIKLGFDSNFVINPMGRKGGMAMLWKFDFRIEVKQYSNHHIHLSIFTILDPNYNTLWYLTGFYDHPKTSRRYES